MTKSAVQEPWVSRATHRACMFTSNGKATFWQGKVKFTFMLQCSWKGGSEGLQDYSRLLKLKQHLDRRVSNFLNFRLTAPNQSCYFKGWIQSWNLMAKSSLNNTMSDKQFWPNKISSCLKPFCDRLYSYDNKIIYDNNNIKK